MKQKSEISNKKHKWICSKSVNQEWFILAKNYHFYSTVCVFHFIGAFRTTITSLPISLRITLPLLLNSVHDGEYSPLPIIQYAHHIKAPYYQPHSQPSEIVYKFSFVTICNLPVPLFTKTDKKIQNSPGIWAKYFSKMCDIFTNVQIIL